MPNVEMSSIEFNIRANAGNAARAINTLKTSLVGLKHVTDSKFEGLSELSASISSLSSVIGHLDGDAGAKLESLSKGVSSLRQVGKLGKVVSELQKLSSLSDTKFDGLTELSGAITSVSTAVEHLDGESGTKLEGLARGIGALKQVGKLTDVSNALQRIGELSNTKFDGIAELSGRLEKLAVSANRIPANAGEKLSGLAGGMNAIRRVGEATLSESYSGFITSMATSLGNLSGANIDKINRFSSSLKNLKDVNAIKISSQLPDQIVMLSAAINELNPESLRNVPEFVKALAHLSQLGDVKINAEIARDLKTLNDAASKINPSVSDRIQSLTTAMTALSNVNPANGGAFAEQIIRLSEAVSHFNGNEVGSSIKSIGAMLRSLKAIQDLGGGANNLTGVIEQLRELSAVLSTVDSNVISGVASSLKALNGVGEKNEQIGGIAEYLTAISHLNFTNINDLAWSLGAIAKSLKTVDKNNNSIDKTREETSNKLKDFTSGGKDKETGREDLYDVENNNIKLKSSYEFLSQSVGKLTARLEAMRTAYHKISGIISATIAAVSRLVRAFAKVAESVLNVSSAVGSKFAGAISKTVGALSKMSLQLVSLPFKKLGATIKSALKTFTQFAASLARIALYRAIRRGIQMISKAFQEGTKNIYQYSKMVGTDFVNTMNSIASTALYIKNLFGEMAAPILNILAPAFDVLADKIATVVHLIAQFMAALGGKGVYTKAIKSVTEWGDATKNANKAAKDFTMSIDELNVLNDKSGSGSGAAQDFSKMFEEASVDPEITDFAQKIKDAIEASDWEGLGKLIGEKVNEVFDLIDWEGIGTKVQENVNAIIETLSSLLETIDFKKIGDGLARFFGALLDNFSAEKFGKLLVQLLEVIPDIIIGFFESDAFDPGLIGEKIGEFINGAITEAQDWLSEQAWEGLGERVGELISAVFQNLEEVLHSHTYELLGESLAEFLNGAAKSADLSSVGATLVRVLTIVPEEILSFFTHLNAKSIGSALADFVNGGINELTSWLDSHKEGFPAVGEKIAALIGSAIQKINATDIANALTGILTSALDLLIGFVNTLPWSKLGEQFGTFITTTFQNLGQWIQGNPFEGLGLKISGFLNSTFESLKTGDIGGTINKFLVDITTQMKAAAQNTDWKGFGETVGKEMGKIDWKTIIGNVFDTLWTVFTGFLDGFLSTDSGKALMSLIAGVTGTIGGLVLFLTTGNPLGLIIAGVGLLLSGVLDDLALKLAEIDWAAMLSKAQGFLVDVLKSLDIGGILLALSTLVTSIILQIPGMILEQFANITDQIAQFFNDIGLESVGGFFEGISEKLRGIKDWLKEHLVDPMVNSVKDLLGIHSPSTVFAEIGDFAIQGLLEGISNAWHLIIDFFAELIPNLITDIKERWQELKEKTSEKWDEVRTNTEEKWNGIFGFLTGKWGETTTEAGNKFEDTRKAIDDKWTETNTDTEKQWDTIKTNLNRLWGNITTDSGTNFGNTKDAINKKWDETDADSTKKWGEVKKNLEGAWSEISKTAETTFGNLSTAVQKIWEGLWGGIKGVINSIIGGVESMANGIIRGINGMIRALNRLKFDIPSWIPEFGGKSFGLNIQEVSLVSIPRLAGGGAVDSGQLFLAREAGPEMVGTLGSQSAVANNGQIVEGIRQGVYDANAEQNALLREQNDLLTRILAKTGTYIDGRQVTNLVERTQRERGVSIMSGGVLA